MKVHQNFLDNRNTADASGQRVCDLLRRSGTEHLWGERSGVPPDTVVVHYMSAIEKQPSRPYDLGAILRIFCDYGVSSHYLIDRRGRIVQLVPEDKKAWHCGGSIMTDGRMGVNDFSIGIELLGTAVSGFTRMQYRSLCSLCSDIEKRLMQPVIYVGHEDVAGNEAVRLGLRTQCKTDPGPLFRWDFFNSCMNELRKKHQS